jgi:uncharacterized OB-fold protein
MADGFQRSTFYLLGCEGCGRFTEPPTRFDAPDFAASNEPMRCNECGELLLLAECFIAPQTTMWQARRGSSWHHVIYPEALPDSRGRQLWT